MNIGQKIQTLKDSMGFKNYQEFGKAVGLPGDWVLELSKKETVTNIDITRLMKIADYFNASVDWLLKDDYKWVVEIDKELPSDDVGAMLENIKIKLGDNENKFFGYSMSKDVTLLTVDLIEEVKKIVKENL